MENLKINKYFEGHTKLFVQQVKEWTEIIIDIETRNKYRILDGDEQELGFIAEGGKGLWGGLKRIILRRHRSMNIKVFDKSKELLLKLKRPFYLFFSDLSILDENQKKIGSVHQRFGFLIFKKYDLRDKNGETFAKIVAPLWRIWTFKIENKSKQEIGLISKKWGGILNDFFTDADRYLIKFDNCSPTQKAIIFGAAICVDMDYFDDNQKRNK